MTQNRPSKLDRRESGLVQRMRSSVREIPTRNPHVLLACSGGKDSVALASLLAELRRLGLLTFSIAHIHHGQHERADLAAAAVQEIGEILNTSVVVHRLKQEDIDAHGGVGLEEAMRRERYLALAQICRDQGADALALAHHQTDQAETILLHIIRGAGVDGLAGMRVWELRDVPWWPSSDQKLQVGLWRPLIAESAGLVADIATGSGLPIVEDPTNIDPKYRRNAIRHQVLPLLESISPGSTEAIARSAEVIAGDALLLARLTEQSLQGCLVGDGLDRMILVGLPEALQRRVVRRWILDRLPALDLSADRVQAVVDLAAKNRGGAVVEIGSGHRVTLRNGLLSID